jgi:hypothetical protein
VEEQSRAAALLTLLSTKSGTAKITEIVTNLARLISAIKRPVAFCVRILNPRFPDHNDVGKLFRDVVDPITYAFCYEKIEMGTSAPEHLISTMVAFAPGVTAGWNGYNSELLRRAGKASARSELFLKYSTNLGMGCVC